MSKNKSQEFKNNGVVVFRSVLRKDEIMELRKALLERFNMEWREEQCGKHIPNAACHCPELSWLYSHPKIISSVKSVLGSDNLVFMGSSDLHLNKLGGWHRDLGAEHGHYVQEERVTNSAFNICKVGVYLQDESKNSNGFKVQLGSHLLSYLSHESPTDIRTAVGDICLFDLRVSHAAMQPDKVEKAIRRLSYCCGKRFQKYGRLLKEAYWSLQGKEQRLSIFFTYGVGNEITKEFHQSVKTINEVEAANSACYETLPSELLVSLEEQHVGAL